MPRGIPSGESTARTRSSQSASPAGSLASVAWTDSNSAAAVAFG